MSHFHCVKNSVANNIRKTEKLKPLKASIHLIKNIFLYFYVMCMSDFVCLYVPQAVPKQIERGHQIC